MGKNEMSLKTLFHHRSGKWRLFPKFSGNYGQLWIFFMFLLCMTQLPQGSTKKLDQMLCNYDLYKKECERQLLEANSTFAANETYCRGEFDRFLCWPSAKSDSLVTVGCPRYFNDNISATSGTGHRYCDGNGSWYRNSDGTDIWRLLMNCNPMKDLYDDEFATDDDTPLLSYLTIIYTAGYVFSMVFLLVALFLFTVFRRLHCVRNYIHINLMISLIFRYLTTIIHDVVVVQHYHPDTWIEKLESGKDLCKGYGAIGCRISTTIWHYAITVNYFWLLVEGIHLQLLLLFPMSSTRLKKHFPFYMALGWGFPLIPIGIWVVLRLAFENVGCWEMDDERHLWWIIRGFVIVTIAINFIIFINVTRVIVSKLRSNNMKRNDSRYALAKSTLALIPLLGVHYIVFLVINADAFGSESIIMRIKIAFETVFTSIQGVLIALLYCFLNAEVQGEIKRWWNAWQTRRRFQSQNTSYTQATSMAFSMHGDHKTLNCKNGHAVMSV